MAPDGTVVALSKAFEDKAAVVAGIAAVREYAGMGLVTDLCPAGRKDPQDSPALRASDATASVQQACEDQRTPADHFRTRAKTLRRTPTGARWARVT